MADASSDPETTPFARSEPADVYVVEHGDTLWTIAERVLGDPRRWREVFELNRGREMVDGTFFEDHDVIEPGWRLTMPPLFDEWSRRPYAYLSSQRFRARYPRAYAKWAAAEGQLHIPLRGSELTPIGHLCREALQEFTTTLVERSPSPDASIPRSHTVAALRHVLAQLSESRTTTSLLAAIVNYWGCLNDLAQRQEHGASREGGGLCWDDARRLVFQSAVVMYEIDRCVVAAEP